jgi:hypothetical protein
MRRKRRRIVPGTLRYKIPDKARYVYAKPDEGRRYRVLLLLAHEYFDGRKWVPFVPGLDNLTTMEERNRVRSIPVRSARDHTSRTKHR